MTALLTLVSILVLVPLLPGPPAGAAPEEPSKAVVQERGGLPHVFARLNAGEPITVAYVGGSITAGAGASDAKKTSYRALVGSWLTATFPGPPSPMWTRLSAAPARIWARSG